MSRTEVEPALADRLREEVRRLKTLAGRTRAVPTLVNVGTLGAERIAFPAEHGAGRSTGVDHGLRADLLTRALDRLADPALRAVWLTRGGALVVGEDDLRWRSAAGTAFARHGVTDPDRLACFVVTRHGWLDVRSEEQQEWPRLRAGTSRPAPSTDRDEEGSWPVVR